MQKGGFGSDFLDKTPKVQAIKKMNRFDFMKISKFCQ